MKRLGALLLVAFLLDGCRTEETVSAAKDIETSASAQGRVRYSTDDKGIVRRSLCAPDATASTCRVTHTMKADDFAAAIKRQYSAAFKNKQPLASNETAAIDKLLSRLADHSQVYKIDDDQAAGDIDRNALALFDSAIGVTFNANGNVVATTPAQ